MFYVIASTQLSFPLFFCHSDLFGIVLCTPVFFVKTKSPVFPCGNKEGGKKEYLTILEASLRVESLRPDKPRTMTVQGHAGVGG